MKPIAVLLTVILLTTGMFSCITKDKPNTYIPNDVVPEIPPKKADTALIPQSEHTKADSPQIVKVRYIAPKKYVMVKKEEAPDCGGNQMPVEDNSDTMVHHKVEIEAEYPGGAAAWQRFLNRNLRYPQELIDNEDYSSAVVQFIVDKEGNVSNVEAVSGPEALCIEMIRVIKKSGRWTPAVQGGRQVRSLKKQPISIHLEAEG
jgi:outer membrane biosynthesis protein TonB